MDLDFGGWSRFEMLGNLAYLLHFGDIFRLYMQNL
jgi:hypothetical protein